MRALVVVESMYGNTARIAAQVRDGLAETWDADLCSVDDRLPRALSEYGLLVLGGPTHAFSMSTAPSREEALKRVEGAGEAGLGIREWLPQLGTDFTGQIAVFDTRMARFGGSAARSMARHLRREGRKVIARRSFRVDSQRGPLREGEAYRARTWGSELAVVARRARAHRPDLPWPR